MAAAVFAVGRLVQSPKPKMLGYFICCKVYLLTSRNPSWSVIDDFDFLNTSGGVIGGVTWIKSYCKQTKNRNAINRN